MRHQLPTALLRFLLRFRERYSFASDWVVELPTHPLEEVGFNRIPPLSRVCVMPTFPMRPSPLGFDGFLLHPNVEPQPGSPSFSNEVDPHPVSIQTSFLSPISKLPTLTYGSWKLELPASRSWKLELRIPEVGSWKLNISNISKKQILKKLARVHHSSNIVGLRRRFSIKSCVYHCWRVS